MDAPIADPFEPSVGFLGIVRILFRWSFVVAPLAALTIWLALAQTDDINPEYTAEVSLILIGPNELIIEDFETGELQVQPINPLQQLGGTLSTVAQITVLALSDPQVGDDLVADGLTDNYEIGSQDRGPILIARAFDSDPELATATVDRLALLVFENLDERQDALNAPESNRIGAQIISSGTKGGPDYGARDRLRLAIAGVGFAISAASAFFLEGIAELWRRRHRTRTESGQKALPVGGRVVDRVAESLVSNADELYASEHDRLVEVLYLVAGTKARANNLAQDAFATADESVWPLSSDAHPIVWLYQETIARALAMPASTAEAHERDDEMWTTVRSLPRETLAVLALVYVGELETAHIGEILAISEDDVMRHHARGARVLRTKGEKGASTESKIRPTGRPTSKKPKPSEPTKARKHTRSTASNANAATADEPGKADAKPSSESAKDRTNARKRPAKNTKAGS